MKKDMKKYLLIAVAAILLLVFPLLVDNLYIQHSFFMIFLFATIGLGWNLIGGYGAQLSLGHAAFFSVGAYTAVLFVIYKSLTPLIGGLVGIGIAVALAALIGYPCFRLRGPYFTLATIAAGEIVRTLLLHFQDFTGGANGIPLPYKGENFLFLQFSSKAPYYYMALVMLVIVFFLVRYLEKAKMGRYLAAIREDQDAAESLGVRTHKVKLVALLISAAITAACGVLYAFSVSFIDPDSVAGLNLSIEIAVVVIVGGIGTLWGPVVGSVVVIFLTEMTNLYLGAVRSGASLVLYGLLLILVISLRPQGLSSLFRRN
jgi:branched-chain amino acid transport system permease protein